MILRSCLNCEFHEIRTGEMGRMSHCSKENCWARFSKCLLYRAIDRFLDQDRLDGHRKFSALARFYSET